MPLRMLRFCRTCLTTRQAVTRDVCERCGGGLLAFLDENGAISREFLVARGFCCNNGCRNCPYGKSEPQSKTSVGRGLEKTCPRCGTGFECRGGSCWCEAAPLGPATLELLERNYVGCLCPACLADFSAA